MPVPPEVTTRDVTVYEGMRNATMQCVVESNPSTLEIRWTHKFGNTTIRNGRDLHVVRFGNISNLVFPYVTYEDAGQYVCSAQNGVSDTNGQLWQRDVSTLTVFGKVSRSYHDKIV